LLFGLSACGGGGGGGSAGGAGPVAGTPGQQAPTISSQPASQTVVEGQPVTFSVAASGSGLSYQWQRDGKDIAGATGASFVLNIAQAADDGSRYSVVVRNAAGSATSAAATLKVSAGQLSLLAGGIGGFGQIDGPLGRFSAPSNIISSPSGELWFNDESYYLKKVTQVPGGVAVVATQLQREPFAVIIGAIDADGNHYENQGTAIYKTTPAGVRTLLAGNVGTAQNAGFVALAGMAVAADGTLYTADWKGATIRKISPAGVVSTLAGSAGQTGSQDGTGAAARFRKPTTLVLDKSGNLYVYDDTLLRKITPGGAVTTIATVPRWPAINGRPESVDPSPLAPMYGGLGLGADGSVYVLSGNIRRVSPNGAVTDFAGFPYTWGPYSNMSQDAVGNMYVVDHDQSGVFRVSTAGEISVIAGAPVNAGDTDGVGAAARFRSPVQVYGAPRIFADAQGTVTLSEYAKIRRITAAGVVTTLPFPQAANGAMAQYYIAGLAYGRDILAYDKETLKGIDNQGKSTVTIAVRTSRGLVDGPREVASMSEPDDFIVDPKGNIYFIDRVITGRAASTLSIRRISPDGAIATVPAPSSLAYYVGNWIADRDGTIVIVTGDSILRMAPDGSVSTLYKAPSDLPFASFYGPVAMDRSGNLYVGGSNLVRKITPAGVMSIVAGTPDSVGVRLGQLPASLGTIDALTVGEDGILYLESENAILKLKL
jgi:sugar lactone lactonase YvrE